MSDTAAQFPSWKTYTGSQFAAVELLDKLKQAQAQALDPQDYEPGAAVKTLDEAMALLNAKDQAPA